MHKLHVVLYKTRAAENESFFVSLFVYAENIPPYGVYSYMVLVTFSHFFIVNVTFVQL